MRLKKRRESMLGIYKPYKPIYTNRQYNNDMVNYSGAIDTITDFAKDYQDVVVLSNLDGKYQLDNYHNKLDEIVLFCGVHAKDPAGEDIFKKLRDLTDRLIYINDDINLYPSNMKLLDYADEIYSYSSSKIFDFLPELENKFHTISPLLSVYPQYLRYSNVSLPSYRDRNIEVFYGGTEGDSKRFAGILEFVIRPEVVFKLKSRRLNLDNRVPHFNLDSYLERTKYTILLADENMYNFNFVTTRFFEYAMRGVFTVAHRDFDAMNIETPNTVPRVNSYLEFYKIIHETTPEYWVKRTSEWRSYINMKAYDLKKQIISIVKP